MNTYKEGYKRQFLTKGGTFQHIFCIFVWYLIFALPFYFSFGGDKFWQVPKNEMLNCQYNFTGYYALSVDYVSNNLHASQEYANIVGSSMSGVAGFSGIKVSEDNTQSTITFSLTGFGSKQVQNVNLILYFKVWIEELGKEISASYVHSFAGDLAYAQTVAVVRYEPETQLNAISTQSTLNYPAYLPNLQPPTSFDSLMEHIITNHQAHRLNQQQTSITVPSQGSSTRQFSIKLIKDTKVNVPYYPSVLQTLKFSFSRWLAFAVIAYFVFYGLLGMLVKGGGLVARGRDQGV